MLKWKQGCRSLRKKMLKKRLLNKASWKKDEGITLVELLASLAILSVVILLVGSVHIFGQRQFISQTESASQSNDMSYALSVMSRDLRKEEADTVEVSDGGTVITAGSGLTFSYSGDQIFKNGTRLIGSVRSMEAKQTADNNIEIIIKSKPPQAQTKTYKTTIYFRR